MKIETYKCDYCDVRKGDANHWFLRALDTTNFLLFLWEDELKYTCDDKGLLYEHICSQGCASKALSQWMETA